MKDFSSLFDWSVQQLWSKTNAALSPGWQGCVPPDCSSQIFDVAVLCRDFVVLSGPLLMTERCENMIR